MTCHGHLEFQLGLQKEGQWGHVRSPNEEAVRHGRGKDSMEWAIRCCQESQHVEDFVDGFIDG